MKRHRSHDVFRGVIRILFGAIFVAGGISHVILGRTMPEGYAVYANAAPFGWMRWMWETVAMPNIGWLTLVLAAYEITAGVLMFRSGRRVRAGAIMMLVFLALISLNGYGWETASAVEDVLKNRTITIVMFALAVPLVAPPLPARLRDAFRRTVTPAPAPATVQPDPVPNAQSAR